MSLALVNLYDLIYKRMRKTHWDEEMLYEINTFEILEINQEQILFSSNCSIKFGMAN